MAALEVCRICLNKNVALENLFSFPLNKYFEPVTGINACVHYNILPYVCYQCSALIKKFFNFRQKCRQTQATLFEIILLHGKLTKQDVDGILNDNQPSVQLSYHTITEDNLIRYIYEGTDTEVKDELNDPESNVEDLLNVYDPKLLLDVKYEKDIPALSSPNRNSLSSDDEPLSIHKTIKTKLLRKSKNKNHENEKIDANDVRSFNLKYEVEGDPSLEVTEIETDISAKKKRVHPKKIKVTQVARRTLNTGGVNFSDETLDLEQYVSVVKLSLEEQLDEINKRKTSSNYMNAAFQCNLCYKGFIDEGAWKHHVGKHDPSAGDEECVVCKFRFKTRRALQKHVMNHEKKYSCKTCSFVSKSSTQARQHQMWHTGVTYKCQYCDEVSTKWTSYLSHVRMKHPSEFICGVCGYSFVSKLGLSMHTTMMHKQLSAEEGSNSAGPFCAECNVQFVSDEAFKRHLITSAKHPATESRHGCRVCGEWFASREELRLHTRREHARRRAAPANPRADAARPINCPHCSEQIPNARELWTHYRRSHPGEKYPIQKDYVCDICGKSFRGNAFLVYHKRTHTEERAYKCKQCPKAFFNRTNLQMHEKCHSENRPYPCTVCLKAFKCKGALDRHFRSHTGVKPYPCEFCGKAFGQSNSRKLHIQTVHLKQPAPYVSKTRQRRKDQPASNPCQFPMYQQ